MPRLGKRWSRCFSTSGLLKLDRAVLPVSINICV